jgi:hypothetical protein
MTFSKGGAYGMNFSWDWDYEAVLILANVGEQDVWGWEHSVELPW